MNEKETIFTLMLADRQERECFEVVRIHQVPRIESSYLSFQTILNGMST
jgi:hypothetical protein